MVNRGHMGWSQVGRTEPQLRLELAQGIKLTDGLTGFAYDTNKVLSLLSNARQGKYLWNSLPLLRSFQFPAISIAEPYWPCHWIWITKVNISWLI